VAGKNGAMARLRYRPGYRPRLANDASSRMGYVYVDNIMDPDTTLPTLIFKKDPEYSEEARKAKYSGTVVLNVEVNESGLVSSIRVIKGVGLGLDEKAIEAVGRWRFNPAQKGGKPVAVQTQVAVNFRLL
jgi:TonB family protein